LNLVFIQVCQLQSSPTTADDSNFHLLEEKQMQNC